MWPNVGHHAVSSLLHGLAVDATLVHEAITLHKYQLLQERNRTSCNKLQLEDPYLVNHRIAGYASPHGQRIPQHPQLRTCLLAIDDAKFDIACQQQKL